MTNLFYPVLFITGLCSLGYQIIWQRYLSILVGAEARSSTLIVAVFLLGLAAGYWFFGLYSAKLGNRRRALKAYGYVELATGAYAMLFPTLFDFIFAGPLAHSNSFTLHLLLTLAMIIPPTFFMGATIPVMTAVMPESEDDISYLHAKIYGVNTLGAFAGIVLTSFYLLNEFGMALSLTILGLLNIAVSLIYLANRLPGEIREKLTQMSVPNNFPTASLYALALLAGLSSLAFETLWFRLLTLSIGSSFLIFPFVLSIVILAIGSGSLTLNTSSVKDFSRTLFLSFAFSVMTYLLSPYLPLFFSNIRVMLLTHEFTYFIYYGLIYLTLLVVLFPGLFFLGRVLPHVYAMLPKDQNDFSVKCGRLYFANTVGTFAGAVVIGYLAFYAFGLQTVYLFCLTLLLIGAGYVFVQGRHWKSLTAAVLLIVLAWALPYPRKFHSLAIYRDRAPTALHFKNIFAMTLLAEETQSYDPKVQRFQDDPNTTVALVSYDTSKSRGKSVFVNGKSDSSTAGDASTLKLLATLPYLTQTKPQLRTANIGIGTGVTSGLLAQFERVQSVDNIEISPAVIEFTKEIGDENYHFHTNPKTRIHERDAFQFFKSAQKKFDIIVSEPSNPWVLGIENLYTSYFYQLASDSLNESGVLVQWFHAYSAGPEALTTIFGNILSVFPEAQVFSIGEGDYAFLASKVPLKFVPSILEEAAVSKALAQFQLNSPAELMALQVLSNPQVHFISEHGKKFAHELFHPTLTEHALKGFFLGSNVEVSRMLPPMQARAPGENNGTSVADLMARRSCAPLVEIETHDSPRDLLCQLLAPQVHPLLRSLKATSSWARLQAYAQLRSLRWIAADEKWARDVLKEGKAETNVAVLQELLLDRLYPAFEQELAKLSLAAPEEAALLRLRQHLEQTDKVSQ